MHFINSLKAPVAVLTASVAANIFTTIVLDNISYSMTSTTVIIPITETQVEYACDTLENTYTYWYHGKIINQDINLDYAGLNDRSSIYEWRLEYENLQNGDIEMDDILKELLEKVSKLEGNVELLKSAPDKIETKLKEIDDKIETKSKEIDDKIETKSKEIDDKIETKSKEIDDKIETKLEKLSEKVSKLEVNVGKLEGNLELLKSVPDKIETMSKEISAIKVDIDYLKKFFSLLDYLKKFFSLLIRISRIIIIIIGGIVSIVLFFAVLTGHTNISKNLINNLIPASIEKLMPWISPHGI